MLSDHPVFPILLSGDLDATRAFYHGTLGLDILREDEGDRIVFRCGGGTQLVVTLSTVGTSDPQTQLAWRVTGSAVGPRRPPRPWRPDRGVRGAGPGHDRRDRGHGPLVGRLVRRSERERARRRPAQGLKTALGRSSPAPAEAPPYSTARGDRTRWPGAKDTHMTDVVTPGPHGPLAHVLAVRGGTSAGPHFGLHHREALIYTLGKAAELEHLIMLQYLFAAFSLKQSTREGLSTEALGRGQRLAQDAAGDRGAGDAPSRARPEPPDVRRGGPASYPPELSLSAVQLSGRVRIELLPFGEAALRHFAFLERPEGMAVDDAEGFEALGEATALEHDEEDEIVPHLQEFDTIGQLYRSIQSGLEHLEGRLGPGRLFIGPADAQATAEHFQWEELVAVTDLASARQAIDTIVEQGEGARGEWRDAHFGRLLGILDEYLALRRPTPASSPPGRSWRPPSDRR